MNPSKFATSMFSILENYEAVIAADVRSEVEERGINKFIFNISTSDQCFFDLLKSYFDFNGSDIGFISRMKRLHGMHKAKGVAGHDYGYFFRFFISSFVKNTPVEFGFDNVEIENFWAMLYFNLVNEMLRVTFNDSLEEIAIC